ncbi:hypothetical protein [Paenimyroides aestuarii]|uniref:Lipoprotein n=1 Tax=Paenimyroides aestuarii TaxID=2968490 RepID=A0ABY5NVN6_9FLAO|nr:hypothetical protein [Paenimyroides aestuarii]UUV22489.1 hypothetical protein NPX36_05465 [Paenimyroides aestuarii]
MKKGLFLLLLTVIAVGCKCEETLTVYSLTEDEKALVPYQLNQTVKWIDHNNNIHNGLLSKITENFDEGGGRGEDCSRVQYNRLISYIQFNNFKYEILFEKRNPTEINLVIQEYIDNTITRSFIRGIKLDSFTTIEFNGEAYENAALLKQSVLDGEAFGHLVYSKTNGIEFILFEDGTWYKRVE